MSYIPLGSRTVAGALDTTGLASGKYSNYFSTAVLTTKVPYYEIYGISVTGLTVVATITVYVNNNIRSTAKLVGNSEWDPAQPILLDTSDEVTLTWDFGTGTAPSATVWMRYDPAIQPRGSMPWAG